MTEEPTAGASPMAAGAVHGENVRGENGKAAAAERPGGGQRSPWDDPRLPWTGRPRAADIACWLAIVGSGLYYLLILPFRASLVGTHPVQLELLDGTTESIVAAAAFARVGHGSLAVAVLAAFPGMMKFDLIYWWAGRLWGERVIWLLAGQRKRVPKYMARVRRWGRRFTWPAILVSAFLPVPNAIVYAIAGWAGTSWIVFLLLDLIGSGLWAGLLAGLGYSLGHHAVVVAQAVSRYGLWVAIGLVVLVMAAQIRASRRKALAARYG